MQTDQRVLLLIEDDETIADLLAYNLRHAGYEVIQEADGRLGLNAALSYAVDLALVDVMLPELDGMAIAREISRQRPELPVIMLTARGDRDSMLEGFEAGAVDYVKKPFDLDELLARIAAHMRRSPAREPSDLAPATVGDLRVDTDRHAVSTSAGELTLKPKEHDLLALLLSRPGHLFGREEITHAVWHQQYMPASRTLDVHVRHLRAKLESIDAPVSIQTVRGVGYRISAK